jgi:hypothetical protein
MNLNFSQLIVLILLLSVGLVSGTLLNNGFNGPSVRLAVDVRHPMSGAFDGAITYSDENDLRDFSIFSESNGLDVFGDNKSDRSTGDLGKEEGCDPADGECPEPKEPKPCGCVPGLSDFAGACQIKTKGGWAIDVDVTKDPNKCHWKEWSAEKDLVEVLSIKLTNPEFEDENDKCPLTVSVTAGAFFGSITDGRKEEGKNENGDKVVVTQSASASGNSSASASAVATTNGEQTSSFNVSISNANDGDGVSNANFSSNNTPNLKNINLEGLTITCKPKK